MIFLYIAIAWIVLLVLFVILWARFAGRRRKLSAGIEQDRQRPHGLFESDDRDTPQQTAHQSHDPGDVA